MTDAYRLVPFGVDASAKVEDLARLHATLLTDSPIALLGQRFMERFYYKFLPREGLIFGAVAYVNNQPVGFVVATHDSSGFMREAMRRWWPHLLWVVGLSVLLAPKSIAAVWEAVRIMATRRRIEDSRADGEVLSLGVLSEYREPNFVRRSGRRIGNELLDYAVTQLRARGVRVIRAMVAADNTPTKLFYSGLGWTLSRSDTPKWRAHTAEFVWRV